MSSHLIEAFCLKLITNTPSMRQYLTLTSVFLKILFNYRWLLYKLLVDINIDLLHIIFRWKDDLNALCGVLWSRVAQNKTAWKKLGEVWPLKMGLVTN